MIYKEEILKNYSTGEIQDISHDPILVDNLKYFLDTINEFRAIYGLPMIVTSGFRSQDYNKSIGGAKNSLHCICLAADFKDLDYSLAQYCVDNQYILRTCGLYIEHPYYTKGWVHFQARPPMISKSLIFKPYASEPKPQHKNDRFKTI